MSSIFDSMIASRKPTTSSGVAPTTTFINTVHGNLDDDDDDDDDDSFEPMQFSFNMASSRPQNLLDMNKMGMICDLDDSDDNRFSMDSKESNFFESMHHNKETKDNFKEPFPVTSPMLKNPINQQSETSYLSPLMQRSDQGKFGMGSPALHSPSTNFQRNLPQSHSVDTTCTQPQEAALYSPGINNTCNTGAANIERNLQSCSPSQTAVCTNFFSKTSPNNLNNNQMVNLSSPQLVEPEGCLEDVNSTQQFDLNIPIMSTNKQILDEAKVTSNCQQQAISSDAMELDEEEVSSKSDILNARFLQLRSWGEKIRSWKYNSDEAMKEKERQLSEANSLVNNLRKSKTELQMELETITFKLSDEMDSRKETDKKLSSSRQLCLALRENFISIEGQLKTLSLEKNQMKALCQAQFDNSDYILKCYVEMKNEIENTKKKYTEAFDKLRATSQSVVEEHKNQLSLKSHQVEQFESELKSRDSHISDLTQRLESLRSENQRLGGTVRWLEDFKIEKINQIEALEKSSAECESKITNLSCLVDSLEEEKSSLAKIIADNSATAEKKEQEYASALVASQRDLENVDLELAKTQVELKHTQSDLNKAEEEILMLKQQLEVSNCQIADLQSRNLFIDSNLKELGNQLLKLQNEKEEGDNKLQKLVSELEQLNFDLNASVNSASKLASDNADLHASLADANSNIAELKNEVASLQNDQQAVVSTNVHLSSQLVQLSNHLADKESELESISEKAESYRSQLEEETKNKKELKDTYDELLVKFNDELDRVSELEAQCTKANDKGAELQGQLQQLESLLAKKDADLAASVKESSDNSEKMDELRKTFELEISRLSDTCDQHQAEIETKNAALEETQKQMAILQEKYSNVLEDLEDKLSTFNAQASDYAQLKKSLDDITQEKSLIEADIEKLTVALEESVLELKNKEESCNLKAKENSALNAQLQDSENQVSKLTASIDSMKKDFAAMLDRYQVDRDKILRKKENDIEDVKSRLEKLKSQNDAKINELSSENKSLKASVSSVSDEKTELEISLKHYMDEIESATTEMSHKDSCIQSLKQELAKLKDKNSRNEMELKKRVEHLQDEVAAKSSQIDELESQKSFAAAAEAQKEVIEPDCSPMKQRSVAPVENLEKTPKSPGLSARLNSMRVLSPQVTPRVHKINLQAVASAQHTTTPVKTPRSILKQPGSASRKRRVLFGGESCMIMSDSESESTTNNEKKWVASSPHRPRTVKTPLRTPKSVLKNPVSHSPEPGKSPSCSKGNLRKTPSRTPRALVPGQPAVRPAVTEDKMSFWFDNDPAFES